MRCMVEPEIVEHENLDEIENAYCKEYAFKHANNLLGFYGVKSNTIHLLNGEVYRKFIFAHEYAHYTQRNSRKFKYIIAVQNHILKLWIVSGLMCLFGFVYLFFNPMVSAVLMSVGLVDMVCCGLSDVFVMQTENEANKIATQQMRKVDAN